MSLSREPGANSRQDWNLSTEISPLTDAMRRVHPALSGLASPGKSWTAWPIHVADLDGAWVDPHGLALIGDAAHAMTPFAAQGAAMAIEDAETLAASVGSALASGHDRLRNALNAWAVARRRRVLKVARRGALNQFAWHASGPVATARDLFLRWRGPEKLATDLDWLYGWRIQPGRKLVQIQLYSVSDQRSVKGSGFHRPVVIPASRKALAVQVLHPNSAVKYPSAS